MREMNLAWSVLKGRREGPPDFPADIALSPRPMSAEGWPSEGQEEEPEEEDYDPVTGRNQAGVTGSIENFQALNEVCGDMTDEQCQAMFDNFMMFRGAESDTDAQGEDEEVGEDEYE